MILVNTPLLNGNEKKYLNECIDTGWISSEGPFVKQFEEMMAARMNRKFAIAVSNGSVALDAALMSLGLQPGDEVIMPTFTIISCGAAVVRTGATPVLVDSDPDTWNMNCDQVAAWITPATKAIMVVHIYGLPVDMDPILALAQKHGLKIIEDAAEMHGQHYKGRPCGSFGDVSIFSFYPNKHITTGEGGMILTDSPEIAEYCRSARNLCFQKHKRFVHEELGWNYRMTNLQAALGVAQMERLDEFVVLKRKMGDTYSKLLAGIDCITLPVLHTEYADNIFWVYGIMLNDGYKYAAEEVMGMLKKEGVDCRPFFWPMHEQPVFHKMNLFINEKYPVAEKMARRGFYIPSGLALTEDEMATVAKTVRRVLQ